MTVYSLTDGKWQKYEELTVNDENAGDWIPCNITEVPIEVLLLEWDKIIRELSEKEIELINVKEEYRQKEFNILFVEDIDFKTLYGKANDKTRAYHVKVECKDLLDKRHDLELSIDYLKRYIGLLKEAIRSRQ